MKVREKLKLVRKVFKMSQEEFGRTLGISRANMSNIEAGKVNATPMLINCVSLMYNVDKAWLLDESNSDLSALEGDAQERNKMIEKYNQLDSSYRKFVLQQVTMLLDLQMQERNRSKLMQGAADTIETVSTKISEAEE